MELCTHCTLLERIVWPHSHHIVPLDPHLFLFTLLFERGADDCIRKIKPDFFFCTFLHSLLFHAFKAGVKGYPCPLCTVDAVIFISTVKAWLLWFGRVRQISQGTKLG